ncbi:MAG: glycine--tRNA ligase subunit beta [Ardenticatenaceae bacterium]|nr:glycine--tRNA ligase subunit beta [Ardenticatenaceae bacterium]
MHSTSFNDVILKLLEFWKNKGCVVAQPYNVQVGAGTMNPATVLRVLGPEPWNVVYVEPSVRPDDGRFGENPNRMQMHHQLQVILQPDPGNPQEIYLESLEAIGLNRKEHDIRFVEDNWESPALGAWGLGWEVWLDGQEITQFTYFQQSGSMDLDPVAVEITYGLDRIISTLQGVDSVWEIDFGAEVGYDQMLLRSEIEHGLYYFNVAEVDALRQVYDIYEREASRCLEAGLVAPAHDYNLKCSHLFNVMDTRGAIGVTERAQYFRRMRNMARAVSQEFVKQREEMGFPLRSHNGWGAPPLQKAGPLAITATTPQTFVLEIGSEELPAADVPSVVRQLRHAVPALLDELRLSYDKVEVHGTPRRLAAVVTNLAARQSDLESEVKGPPADRAFDADGNPTRAAIGFARGKGIDVGDLRVVEEGSRRYVAATVYEEGRPVQEVLSEHLNGLIAGLKFPKSMRWNASGVAFSRPVRWLVALFGPDVVPFAFAGVASGRVSRGLRPDRSPEIAIDQAADYEKLMAAHGIVIDAAKREQIITSVAKQLAEEKGGTIPNDQGLVNEVTNLIERPTVFIGRFEEKYLDLPADVLVAVMRKHQRYFPVYGSSGKLLPYFVAVRNGDTEHLDKVTHGNEQVIRARFADAAFFYSNDSDKKLTDFLSELHKLTFQADLGSMLDKTKRLEQLVPVMAKMLDLDEAAQAQARRAAELAKADLASSMVVEMTSLQGVMGGQYARLSGESEAVAAAIAEQYEAVSQTKAGLALALADRLDSLMGLYAAGLAPKGSNDPFAMRRAAIQIIENLIGNEQSFDLKAALRQAAALLPDNVDRSPTKQRETLDFISDRLSVILQEEGYRPTHVRAVLNEQAADPFAASRTVKTVAEITQRDDWQTLLDAYARCVRITRNLEERYEMRPEAFTAPAEKQLLTAYQQAAAASDGTLKTFVTQLAKMVPAITAFFDDILVMDDDLDVRHNRLALLQGIAGLTAGIADLSELEGF